MKTFTIVTLSLGAIASTIIIVNFGRSLFAEAEKKQLPANGNGGA